MRKFIYIFTITLVIFAWSCKKDKEIKDTTSVKNNNIEEVQNPSQTLKIIGDQIWVRSEPKTGQVVMKLDDGTVCKLIEKGEKQTIKGTTDYWYKIDYNGKEGWVFGSQTTLRQKVKSASISTMEEVLERMKKSDFKSLIASDDIFVLDNKHAIVELSKVSTTEILKQLPKINENTEVYYNEQPSFNGETFDKNGLFITSKTDEIFTDWVQIAPDLKDQALKTEKKIEKVVYYVNNENIYTFYIAKTSNSYNIVIIDISQPGEA